MSLMVTIHFGILQQNPAIRVSTDCGAAKSPSVLSELLLFANIRCDRVSIFLPGLQ